MYTKKIQRNRYIFLFNTNILFQNKFGHLKMNLSERDSLRKLKLFQNPKHCYDFPIWITRDYFMAPFFTHSVYSLTNKPSNLEVWGSGTLGKGQIGVTGGGD